MATNVELQAAVARNIQQLKDARMSSDPKVMDKAVAELEANTQKLGAAAVANKPQA